MALTDTRAVIGITLAILGLLLAVAAPVDSRRAWVRGIALAMIVTSGHSSGLSLLLLAREVAGLGYVAPQ